MVVKHGTCRARHRFPGHAAEQVQKKNWSRRDAVQQRALHRAHARLRDTRERPRSPPVQVARGRRRRIGALPTCWNTSSATILRTAAPRSCTTRWAVRISRIRGLRARGSLAQMSGTACFTRAAARMSAAAPCNAEGARAVVRHPARAARPAPMPRPAPPDIEALLAAPSRMKAGRAVDARAQLEA